MSISDKALSLFNRDVFVYSTKIILGAIIARKLGPFALGIWVIFEMLPSYAEAFGRLKFDIASVYFLGKKKYGLGETVFFLNITSLVSSFVIISLILLNIDLIESYLFKDLEIDIIILYLILFYILLVFISINYQYIIIYLEDIKAYNILIISKGVLSSVISVFLLLIFDMGIMAMAIGPVVGYLIAIFYAYWKVSKIENMKYKIRRVLLFDMVSYSYKIYFSGLASHFSNYISSLIVALLLGPAEVAFYQLGKSRIELLRKIPSSIGTIIHPVISKSDNSSSKSSEILAKSIRVSLVFMTLLGLLACLFIYPLTILLYGKDFLPITKPFWILTPSIIAYYSSSLVTPYFLGVGRPDIPLKVSLFAIIPQSFLCYFLIPKFGISGAAISTALSFLLLSFVNVNYFKNFTGFSYSKIVIPKAEDYQLIIKFIKVKLKL
jgi:O-antigen/teichoic acid export membrane protein